MSSSGSRKAADGAPEATEDGEAAADPKYKLPDILLTEFTPQEVNNMQHLFEELDEDKSGAIDVVELGVLFDKLEEEVTQERLREIIAEVDDDDSGELEYPEFMMLMAKFKKGESKFAKAASLLNELNSTPAAELERQCRKRGLKVSFEFVETREATSMAAQQEIYKCTVQGEWIERIQGKMRKITEPRYFEGIAPNTRDAKMAAAQAALSKLREAIPGVAYKPGEIPDAWREWYETNLDNGVDADELLQTFVTKGFIPAKNLELMQLTSVHLSMQRLVREERNAKLSENGRYIPPEWLDWAEQQLDRGIKGTIVLQILVKLGFRPERNPHLLQLLRSSRGGTTADPVQPFVLDYWGALERQDEDELRRYMRGGQDPNERRKKSLFGFKDEHRRINGRTALEMVCLAPCPVNFAVLLVASGAKTDTVDGMGRTPLHHAATGGSRGICEYLLAGTGAELHVKDNYGDTPLHLAAEHGRVDVIKFFTEWQEERLRRFQTGKDGVGGITHRVAAKRLFEKMQDEKLSRHVPRRFPITWYREYCHRYRNQVHRQPLQTLVEGAAETRAREKAALPDPPWGRINYINDFVEHIDTRERASLAPITDERISAVMAEYGPEEKTEIFVHADKSEEVVPLNVPFDMLLGLLDKVLEQSYVNVRNVRGRTPIFNAVEPLHIVVTEGHQDSLQVLIDEHQADVRVKDYQLDSIVDILKRGHQGVPKNWRTRPEDGGELEDGELTRRENDNGDSDTSDDPDDPLNFVEQVSGEIPRLVQEQEKMKKKKKEKKKKRKREKEQEKANPKEAEDPEMSESGGEMKDSDEEQLMGLGNDSAGSGGDTNGSMTKANQRAMMAIKKLLTDGDGEKAWQELRSQCTVVRRILSWVEYNHPETGLSFYFQQRSGRTLFETPGEIRTAEQSAIGWAELEKVSERRSIDKNGWWEFCDVVGTGDLWYRNKAQRLNQWKKPANFDPWEDSEEYVEKSAEKAKAGAIKKKVKSLWKKVRGLAADDWTKLRGHSHALRNVGQWVEYRDDETAALYYYNQGTQESCWEKPAVLLDLEKRRFAWEMVVSMGKKVGSNPTSTRWLDLHDRSTELRQIDEFKEYRCPQTSLLFYYNQDERTYSWTKPETIRVHEGVKFGDEVGDETIGDWEKVGDRCENLRQFGNWKECRDNISGTVFYVNTLGAYGGGAWEKPLEFIRAERRQYGWEILNTMREQEWKPVRRRSDLIRTVDPWQELRDSKLTGVSYYYNKYKTGMEAHKFNKPDEVLHLERERNTWQIRYRDSVLLEKEGPWEARRDNPPKKKKKKKRKPPPPGKKKSKKRLAREKREREAEEAEKQRLANRTPEEIEADERKRLKAEEARNWWTNIENCKVFTKRPAGMDEARVRRKRHEALTREQTLLEWDFFKGKSVAMRCAGPWEEYKHKETQIIFYFNVDEESYSFQKPDLVVDEDIKQRGADIIAANRPEDWRRMRLEADTLRRAGDWEEQRDRVTECVFYYNSVTGESAWQKPDIMRENELKERGWQMVQEQTPEQWERMIKQSKLVRLFERDEEESGMQYLCVQTWRDRGTQAIFYHDVEKKETTWEKPDGLLFDEQVKLAADLPNGTDREWGLVRMRAERFRRINAWHEFRDSETQAIFYYNDDTGHYQLKKPGPVLENEMRKRAWALVRRQSTVEWAELHSRAEVLRQVLYYDELRDEETGCVFYCDCRKWSAGRRIKRAQAAKGSEDEEKIMLELKAEEEAENKNMPQQEDASSSSDGSDGENDLQKGVGTGTGGDAKNEPPKDKKPTLDSPPDGCFSWLKPKVLNEEEKRERGVSIASRQVEEDWTGLRMRAVKLRDLCGDEWQEFRDAKTGCTFYFNLVSEMSHWKKPEDVELADKGVRGWMLINKYAGKPTAVHCGGLWAEHADAKTGAVYYRNTSAAPGLETYNGGSQWEKPEMLVREEEEIAERARRGRAMVMYRKFEASVKNWRELARRCDIQRTSKFMHDVGWDELSDPLTGITIYQRSVHNGMISSNKPASIQKFDRESFYWYLIRKSSIRSRIFKETGWEEYVDPRVRSFMYFHPEKRISQWGKPSEVTKAHEKRAWEEQILAEEEGIDESGRAQNKKSLPGGGKRGPSGWKTLVDTLTGVDFYHHQVYGCTWEKPQAVDDDQRRVIRDQRDLERKMAKLEETAINDFDCHLQTAAQNLRLNLDSILMHVDEFESDDEGTHLGDSRVLVEFKGQLHNKAELTKDELDFIRFREKRIRLKDQLQQNELNERQKKHRRNMKRKRRRLGARWKNSNKMRYNMLLFSELAVERKLEKYQLCVWGCGEWMMLEEMKGHNEDRCPKRMLPCELGCGLYLRAEFWEKVRDSHEENECIKRMVMCPQGCGRQVVFEDLETHCNKECAKRRIPPLRCRLGCGKVWIGGMDRFKAMTMERDEHESEECLERDVPCTWVDIKNNNTKCMAVVKAKDLREHRKQHLATLGVRRFRTPGAHSLTIPRRTRQIKLQLWGAGGGGGHLLGSNNGGGRGGGGGFIEGILEVTPGETIEVVVGEGGHPGIHGKLLTDEMSLEQAAYEEGICEGGQPGGGRGRSNNQAWAAGGGGGFSAIFRNGPWGKETILVAGGGGGGGSRNGCPGGGFVGGYTPDDPRNGGPGTQESGGDGGRPPFGEDWCWEGSQDLIVGQAGTQWQGGDSGQFGGGGGGGFYGGGGGGSTPGIVGGGGGGSSFASDAVIGASTNSGHKFMPGGLDRKPTPAVGLGEWDEKEGVAGEGGPADEEKVEQGRHGLIVVRFPGFYGS